MRLRPSWILTAIGLAILAIGGVSIFSTPADEVLFYPSPPLTTCTRTAGCISIYTLEIGNTGERAQKEIRVSLRSGSLPRSILPLTVRNFGKVARPFNVEDSGGLRVYTLRDVRPGMRIELQMTLRGDSAHDAPRWSDLLARVESSGGRVRRGDPASTSLARMFYSLFGWI